MGKIRGREIISVEGEAAEEVLLLSRITGDDESTVLANALALLNFIADNPDSYTVIRDNTGKEVKRIKNSVLIESVRKGDNPFQK